MGRGLLPVPLCALLRHAGVGSREQVQPPFPLPRRRPFWGGGAPPGPGGAEGRACGSPAGMGAGGGVGGAAPPPALGPVWEGGGELGGPFGHLAKPPDGRGGGGAAWQSWPRGRAIGWGVEPFPRPPLRRAGSSCRPSLGPLIPPAVVARRWPAGGGREG